MLGGSPLQSVTDVTDAGRAEKDKKGEDPPRAAACHQ